jgi:hypothetical protein
MYLSIKQLMVYGPPGVAGIVLPRVEPETASEVVNATIHQPRTEAYLALAKALKTISVI